MTILRKTIGSLLITATLALAAEPPPDFKVARFSTDTLAQQELAARQSPVQDPAPAPAPPPPAQAKPPRKSNKTKWIIIGAVAGAATIALLAANRRFGNEGRPIFR